MANIEYAVKHTYAKTYESFWLPINSIILLTEYIKDPIKKGNKILQITYACPLETNNEVKHGQ